MQLVKVCQYMLQNMQYNLEQQYHVQQLLEEEKSELIAFIKSVPSLSLQDVDQGLVTLENNFMTVQEADLDAMFTQVQGRGASKA